MKVLYYIGLLIIVIVLVGIGYFVIKENMVIDNDEINDFQEMDLRIEFIPKDGIESQEIRVLNEEDESIFQLTIDELNQWTEENWDVFAELPEVGGREVDPTGFGFFDRAASISRDNRKMIFSVSDYAVATTISFLIVVNIETGEMNMIDEPARGGVEDYFWSEDNELVTYTLGTARAGGDFLSVDNVVNLQREFILSEEDILKVLDPDHEMVEAGQFMPVFQDLEWSKERLYFTTEHPGNNRVEWSIDKNGTDLKRVNHETYESSLLNVSFEYPSLATISYEDERVKITYVGEDSHMTQITDGFTFFIDVKDKEGRSLENIADEEFEKRTQVNEPLTSPHQIEINDKSLISFEIEGGLNGEHTFFVFESNDKIIITSQFIADPHNNNYQKKVRDILFSVSTK